MVAAHPIENLECLVLIVGMRRPIAVFEHLYEGLLFWTSD